MSWIRLHASRWRLKAQATWHIIASRPHVVILPLALTALMMGLGIWGVIAGAEHTVDHYRTKAEFHVQAVASAMQLSIQQAVMPAIQVADWIQHTLNYTTVQERWVDRVEHWWQREHRSALALQHSPGGIIRNVYPTTPFADSLVDIDLFKDPVRGPWVVKSIQKGELTVLGPFTHGSMRLMSFVLPILVPNVSEAETWGIPGKTTSKACPPGVCYNATTRTKLWGMVGLTMNATAFLENDLLLDLSKAGYQAQVWRPPNALSGETERVAVHQSGARPQPADAIRAVLPMADSEWEVYVWVDSWEPNWKTPLLIVVLVASALCGCLIFAVLLSWEEHRLLLHSILPKATIKRMKTELLWMDPQSDGKDSALALVEIETPAQHMQTIIRAFLAGETPPMALVVAVQQALQRSADVYRPANQDVESRINAGKLDSEVQRALVQQLAGRIGSTFPDPEEPADTDLHLSEPEEDTLYHHDLTSSPELVACDESAPEEELSSGLTQTCISAPLPKRAKAPRNLRRSCDMSHAPACPDLHTMLGALVARPNSAQAATIDSGSGYLITASGSGNGSSCLWNSMSPSKAMGAPEKPIMEQLDRVLNNASTWAFDVFELDEITQGHSLSVLGYWLMHNSGCMEFAHMDGRVLSRFLRRVEDGYKSNPTTTAATLQTCCRRFMSFCTRAVWCQATATSSHCWDATWLRSLSNGEPPLAAAWGLLLQPGFNCLSGLGKGNWDKLRKLVIELVLATDMRQHFAIMGQFSMLHSTTGAQLDTDDTTSRDSDGAYPAGPASKHSVGPPSNNPTSRQSRPTVPLGENDKLLSLQVALKCADIGNLAAPLPVYLRWVGCLEEEMFLQGDAERARGMIISPLCDRTKEGVSKSQVGFFDFVVLPLFSNFTQKFKASKPLLNAVVNNYRYWQDKATQTSTGSSHEV